MPRNYKTTQKLAEARFYRNSTTSNVISVQRTTDSSSANSILNIDIIGSFAKRTIETGHTQWSCNYCNDHEISITDAERSYSCFPLLFEQQVKLQDMGGSAGQLERLDHINMERKY